MIIIEGSDIIFKYNGVIFTPEKLNTDRRLTTKI